MERSIEGIVMAVYGLCDVYNVLGCARKALKQCPSEGIYTHIYDTHVRGRAGKSEKYKNDIDTCI